MIFIIILIHHNFRQKIFIKYILKNIIHSIIIFLDIYKISDNSEKATTDATKHIAQYDKRQKTI